MVGGNTLFVVVVGMLKCEAMISIHEGSDPNERIIGENSGSTTHDG